MKKRLTALILILTMLWSSGLEVVPGLFSAYAESERGDLETAEAASERTGTVPVVHTAQPAPATAAEPLAPAASTEQNAPAENVEQNAPAGNAEQTSPAENMEQNAPAENVEQDAPVENAEQNAPAEKAEQNAPAETVEQNAPAENVEQNVPTENVEQNAPAENVEQIPPAENVEQTAPAEHEEQPAPMENTVQPVPQETIEGQTDSDIAADEGAIASGDDEEQTLVCSSTEEIDQPETSDEGAAPAEEAAGEATGSENEISADTQTVTEERSTGEQTEETSGEQVETLAEGTAAEEEASEGMAEDAGTAEEPLKAVSADDTEEIATTPQVNAGLFMLPENIEEGDSETIPASKGTARSLDIQVGDYVITAYGNIPEGAEIQAVEMPLDAAEQVSGLNPLFAYDIRILVNGEVWQPGENGEDVKISVKDLNGQLHAEDVNIVHVKKDFMNPDGTLSETALDDTLNDLSEGNVETETIETGAEDGVVSFDTNSFSGFFASAVAQIQKLVKEALSAHTALNSIVQVKLDRDTIYEGDVEFTKDWVESTTSKSVQDGFGIEIAAEDAGNDYLQSSGTTTILGDVTIKGIKVVLAGINMAAGKKVTVDEAAGKLEYYGTKKDDDLTVEAKNGASASVFTGEGNDTVNATATGSSRLNIETGAGNDDISITQSNLATVTVETGADDDTVSVMLDAEATTAGSSTDNTLTADISTGTGDDTVMVAGKTTGAGVQNNTKVNINLGSGMDQATIDMTAAIASKEININGSDDNDRLHLTGDLDGTKDPDSRITGTAEDLNFAASGGKSLNVTSKGIETITDDLQNKREEEINITTYTNPDSQFSFAASNRFTNYILTGSADQFNALKDIIVTTTSGQQLLLSSFVIDTRKITKSADNLTVKAESTVQTSGLQLVMHGKHVDVKGRITGDLVRIEAASDRNMDAASIDVNSLDTITTGEGSDSISLKLLNISDQASITIDNGARVESSGDIILTAWAEQKGGLSNLTAGDNVINLKLAKARVDVKGKLIAGNSNANGEAITSGSVSISASTKTSAGFNSDGVEYDGMPVAIALGNGSAVIDIAQGSVIEATDSIRTTSKSDVNIVTHADSGSLPFAAAVSVFVGEAKTTMNGTITAGKDVNASASGKLNVRTVADNTRDGVNDASGAYLSVGVAQQEVKAEFGGNARVKAGRNVDISSTAQENVETRAESSRNNKETTSEKNPIVQAYETLTDVWDVLKAMLTGTGSTQQENDGANLLDETIGQIEVTPDTTQNGDSGEGQNSGDEEPEMPEDQPPDVFEDQEPDENINLGNMVANATSTVNDPDDTSGDSGEMGMRFAGALAVSVTKNDNRALISEGAEIIAGKEGRGSVEMIAREATQVTTFADGSAISTPGNDTGNQVTTNLGAAIALTVTKSKNVSDISGAVDSAENIKTQAFGEGAIRTESVAGYSRGDKGIGGAVSLQVASVDSKARIHETAALILNDGLTAEAQQDVQFFVDADASGSKRSARKMGVGVGIAAGIDGADTVAAIADGATVIGNGMDGDIGSLTLRAEQAIRDHVASAAGAVSNKTSLMAVAAVDIVSTSATAYMGKVSDSMLRVRDGVNISAGNYAEHEVSSDGAVAGIGTGIGAAVGGAIVTDVSKAQLNQHLTAGSVNVSSVTDSSVVNENNASAEGGKKPFTFALGDSLTAKLLMGVAKLMAMSGNYYINKDQLDYILKFRLRFVTTEGTIGVSASAGVNILKSKSLAEVKDDVNVTSIGRMAVTSKNRTESVAKGNGSTANSMTGIGVGVAYNSVTMENIARVGTGVINAGTLDVTATTREKQDQPSGLGAQIREAETEEAREEALKNGMKGIVGDYVTDMAREIGLTDLPDELMDGIVNPVIDEATQEILEAVGLFDWLGDVNYSGMLDKIVDSLHDYDLIAIPIVAVIAEFGNFSNDVPILNQVEPVRKFFVDHYNEHLLSKIDKNVWGLASGVLDAVVEYLAGNTYNLLTKGIDSESRDKEIAKLKSKVKKETKRFALDNLIDMAYDSVKETVDDLLEWLDEKGINDADNLIRDALKELGAGKKIADSVSVEKLDLIVDAYRKDKKKEEKNKQENQNADGDASAEGEANPELDNLQNQSLGDLINNVSGSVADKATEVFTEDQTNNSQMDKMIENLADQDFSQTLAASIIKNAEERNVILSDEQIATLRNPTDLQLDALKEAADGHVIDTQAIAGAGGASTGIAGSAAFTSLDFTTRAEIADQTVKEKTTDKDGKEKETSKTVPGGSVTVAGEMRVIAEDRRYLNDVASAQQNEKGNAVANTSAGDAANSDLGTADDVTSVAETSDGSVRLTIGKGGIAAITGSEKEQSRPVFRFTLEKGFSLEEENGKSYAACTYKDKSGEEKTGKKIEIKKDGDAYYIDTKDLKDVPADSEIQLELNPVEVLNKISIAAVDKNGKEIRNHTSVNVKNRESDSEQTAEARVGDMVYLHVNKISGKHVDTVSYTYIGADGKNYSFEINPKTASADKKSVYTLVTVNDDEYVYAIRMPDVKAGTKTQVSVFYADGAETSEIKMPYFAMNNTSISGIGRRIGIGAAFSMVTGSAETEAVVGQREDSTGSLKAGNLTVSAFTDHEEVIASVAGADPFSNEVGVQDASRTAIDASAAVDLLKHSAKAEINEKNQTNITGYQAGTSTAGGDLTVTATEKSETLTHASAFTVGKKTSIGATGALNMASSEVLAKIGGAEAAGSVTVAADSSSKDCTIAVATATGPDLQLMGKWFNIKSDDGTVEKKENSSQNGNQGNSAASAVNEKLNQNRSEEEKKKNPDADNDMPMTTNILRSQGVKLEPSAILNDTESLWEGIQAAAGMILGCVAVGKEALSFLFESKYQVAAAVGFTKADHTTKAVVTKAVHAGKEISVTAENNGNFSTIGTSASMSIIPKSSGISGGAAVTQIANKAVVEVKNDLISANQGDITLKSTLTQNTDPDYINRLAVQSVSGAVSGYGSTVSFGGAVSMLKSESEASVTVDKGTRQQKRQITGGNITISASDLSWLAGRAGAVSLSMGSSFGMGGSATIIQSENKVTSNVGEYTDITGTALTISAEKLKVDSDTYKNALKNNSLMSIEEKGDKDGKDNELKVNLTSNKILKQFEGVNEYTWQNYYAEAISGSAQTGKNIAGSGAVILNENKIEAKMGDNVTVVLNENKNKADADGRMTLKATDDATTRLVSGAASVGVTGLGVGLSVAVLHNKDTASAAMGESAKVTADGPVSQHAGISGKTQLFSASAGVTVLASAGSGTLNILNNETKATSTVGTYSSIKSKANDDLTDSISITSGTKLDMMALDANSTIAIGKGTAAGATANYIVDSAKATTEIGNLVTLTGKKTVQISSDIDNDMISGAASQAASATTDGTGFAGAINLIRAKSAANTNVGKNVTITSELKDIDISAHSDAWLLNVTVSMPGAVGKALGGSGNINLMERTAKVNLSSGTLSAKENISVIASGKDKAMLAGLVSAGSVCSITFDGNVVWQKEKNRIGVSVENGYMADGITADAGKNAVFDSRFSHETLAAAGSIALANMSAAIGATILTVDKDNRVTTDLGSSTVTARNNGSEANGLSINGNKVSGIYIGANAEEKEKLAAGGVSLSGSAGITGTALTYNSMNKVKVNTSQASLNALTKGPGTTEKVFRSGTVLRLYDDNGNFAGRMYYTNSGLIEKDAKYQLSKGRRLEVQFPGSEEYYLVTSMDDLYQKEIPEGASVTVEATDNSKELMLAGGVNFGLSAGVGANIVIRLQENEVEAKVKDIAASKKVAVKAESTDTLTQLNVNVGAGKGAVEIGLTINDMNSKVNTDVKGNITSYGDEVSLDAGNDTTVKNASVALAGASELALTPVFVYTGFSGEQNVILEENTKMKAKKAFTLNAVSEKEIHQYTTGFAVSGNIGLSGAVSVADLRDGTHARALTGTEITAGSLNINAESNYTMRAASAALGAGKTAVAVNGIVSLVKADTLAELDGKVTTLGGRVSVKATSRRDVINGALNIAGAGETSGALTVLFLSAGDKMDQEAADQLTYGSSKSKDETSFDASALNEHLENNLGIENESIRDLPGGLGGDGRKIGTKKLGSKKGDGYGFDASSGYKSDSTSDDDEETLNETDDLKNGRKVGYITNYDKEDDEEDENEDDEEDTYTSDPLDSVIARIGSNAVVISYGADVYAEQETLADLFGATVSASGAFGGGVSFTGAKLYSNVIAASLGKVDVSEGNFQINAVSRSGEVTPEAGTEEGNRMKALAGRLGDNLNPGSRSIRAIGLVVGAGGEASFAVAGGAVRLDNITRATLGGTVKNGRGVLVQSEAKYKDVMAATVAISAGGGAAISGSIAAAVTEGTVDATVAEDTEISGKNLVVHVKTDTVFNVDAISTAAAASGGGSVIAGLALASNKLKQNTTVERGAKIDGTDNGIADLLVKGISNTTANALLLGASAGFVGVGMGVAIANVKPTLNTTLGAEGTEGKSTTLHNVTQTSVENEVTSNAKADVLSATAAGVAISGNVLLVYNDTEATAKAAAIKGNTSVLYISSKLNAFGSSQVTAATAGGLSVGVTVSHVDLHSKNNAVLETDHFELYTNRIVVRAGEENYHNKDGSIWNTQAIAKAISAEVGIATIGVNTAVARNRTENNAKITGTNLTVQDVELYSYGRGKAEASVTGMTVGGMNISLSVVNAMNETTSRSHMELSGRMEGNLRVASDVKGATDAKLFNGGGSILSDVATYVATARGRTASIARVNIGTPTTEGYSSYSVRSTGRDDVNTLIENLSVTKGVLGVGVMVGRAFSTDVYDAELVLTGGAYKLKNVSVTTEYETSVNADTTPSASGVQTSLVNVGVNKATAKNNSYAMAKLQTQGDVKKQETTTLDVQENVTVLTRGSAVANAVVKPAVFTLDLLAGVAVNKAKADVNGTQAAILLLGLGGIEKAKLVDVQSIVINADAQASVGASGAKEDDRKKIKISAVSVDSNSATANESLASTATVMGSVSRIDTINGMVSYGHWEEREETYVDYDTAVEFEKEDAHPNDNIWFDGRYHHGTSFNIYELWDRDKMELLDTAFSEEELDTKKDYYTSKEGGVTNVFKHVSRANAIMGEDGNYYMVKTEKRKVWVEELNPGKFDVNVYNPEKNILQANALNIYAGMAEGKQSSATANSNGAKAFGIVTVGDLNASAHTGESISAMLEGVTATITGDANIKAASNTKATATGYEPGGWAAAAGSTTNAKSGVGTQDEKETVTVVIGTGALLQAKNVTLMALNNGEAESSIEKEKTVGILANITKGGMPTESWYDTLITVGENAQVEATNGNVNLFTADSSKSTSKVKSSGFSLGVNYNSMKGENEVHQENNIDIVNGANVKATDGSVRIQGWQSTKAEAETKYDGTGAVVASSTMYADNIVKRVVRANIGEKATITATRDKTNDGGDVVIMVASGIGDENQDYLKDKFDMIRTYASVECKGFVGLSNAKAHADVQSVSEIVVQGGAEVTGWNRVKLEALSTSVGEGVRYNADLFDSVRGDWEDHPGIITEAKAESKAGIPLPNATAKASLNFNTFINIHMRDENKANVASDLITKITSQHGEMIIKASNERLNVHCTAKSVGKGAAGASNANAWNDAILSNAVWIDDAELKAYGDLIITADNGGILPANIEVTDHKSLEAMLRRTTYSKELQPYFYAWSKAELKGIGSAKAHSRVTGSQINQIRSYDVNRVTLSSTTGRVIHLASEPMASVRSKVDANAKVPKIFGIKLGKTKTKEDLIWYYFNRCDFCGIGREYDVKPTEQMPLQKRYKEAYERALLPISDVQRMVDKIGSTTKAHYGLFDDQTVASIFALSVQHILTRDIRLSAEKIAGYKLWTNAETDHTTYLLPNATQLHIKGGKLDFVTEILRGDALGDGKTRYIALYTAVTSGAYARGIIPIGSTGTLNLKTGVLTLPSHADYELYLHEVSSGWLLKQFESGMMRRASAPQESLNACALENGELPEMTYADAPIPDGEKNGWLIFWLGNTPETVADADETLVYLLVNRATDEVDAYRTSVNMLARGEAPVDVSVYIYRDSKADRNDEEVYDVFFFDTPEGEMSLVKVITNTIGEEMQIPRSMQIKLRRFRVKDSADTAFCLYDQVLIFCNEEKGKASALDGFYTAVFDSSGFESAYVRVTYLDDGSLVVIVKKDQPVWGEWTGEDTAETIDGTCYKLIDGSWYEVDYV